MDFSKYDSRAAAETARDMHIKHPVTGYLLFDDGKPCIVCVLGTESAAVQKTMADAARAKMKGDKTEQTLEAIQRDLVANAKNLVTGFKNVMRGEKPATAADAEWFLGLQMINGNEDEKSFVEQVTEFATTRANFLGNV